jgi:subtilisin-like proprotein convertase family protein
MAVLAFAATARAQVFSSTTAVPILDDPTVVSEIQVSGIGTIRDLNVLVNIDHTWDADLDIVLVGPDGADYLHLTSDNGGSGDNYRFTRFDDDCPVLISAGSGAGAAPPFSGNFLPEGGPIVWIGSVPLPPVALSAFRDFHGRSGNGTWSLLVDDDSAGVTGVLRSWSLEFNGAFNPLGPAPYTGPLPPVGTGFAVPDRAAPLQNVRLAVRVVPGINPPSTQITVQADASAIGGAQVTTLTDPDRDLIFDAIVNVGGATQPGVKTIPFEIRDAQSRLSSGSFQVIVLPSAPVNDLCTQAIEIPATGPFPFITQPVSVLSLLPETDLPMCVPQAGRDVWYRYQSPENDSLFVATCPEHAIGITVPDTVIAVYESPDGGCQNLIPMLCLDDTCELRESDRLDVQAGRTYYIQVARFGTGLPTPGSDLIVLAVDPTSPTTDPDGTASATPSTLRDGEQVNFNVVVTPGTEPLSTGITVTLNGSTLGGPSQILMDTTDGLSFAASLVVHGDPGLRLVRYTIRDAQLRTATGSIAVRILPPPSPNDTCETAIVIPGDGPFPVVTAPVVLPGNSVQPEADMCLSAGGFTSWYSFTPVRSFQYEFVTCSVDCPESTAEDTIIAIYGTASGCSALNLLACADGSGSGCSPRATLISPVLEAGQTYFVQVGTASTQYPQNSASVLQMAVRERPPVGACCLPDGCRVLLADECEDLGGSFLGQGVICGSDGFAVGFREDHENAQPFASIGAGVPLTLEDDGVESVSLGFPLVFHGEIYHDVYVCANGFVSFGRGVGAFQNTSIPSVEPPNASVYAMWDDLQPPAAGPGGGVSYLREISGNQSRLTVQWNRVPQWGQADENTFQIVIFQDGAIELRYADITPEASPGDYTVGIEDGSGTRALSINGAALGSGNVSFRFEPVDPSSCCRWRADGCFADFDDNGGIDADDVIAFFSAWDVTNACADVDDSGGVDSDDVIVFFGAWDVSGIGVPGC